MRFPLCEGIGKISLRLKKRVERALQLHSHNKKDFTLIRFNKSQTVL